LTNGIMSSRHEMENTSSFHSNSMSGLFLVAKVSSENIHKVPQMPLSSQFAFRLLLVGPSFAKYLVTRCVLLKNIFPKFECPSAITNMIENDI
ncbi:hypothetical protein P4S80_15245, partial [Aeribacillus composti]|uniref:hypothetical protein n=1 Tax=Aeribacillus composti TaxID=1868734 RepID=UPI002E1A62F6|nr:hypothetical protein [Aeribacillus composti]